MLKTDTVNNNTVVWRHLYRKPLWMLANPYTPRSYSHWSTFLSMTALYRDNTSSTIVIISAKTPSLIDACLNISTDSYFFIFSLVYYVCMYYVHHHFSPVFFQLLWLRLSVINKRYLILIDLITGLFKWKSREAGPKWGPLGATFFIGGAPLDSP